MARIEYKPTSRLHSFAFISCSIVLFFSLGSCSSGSGEPGETPSRSNNNAPDIWGAPPTSSIETEAYSFQPASKDDDGDTLSFSIINKPDWLNFNSDTGRLSGTPTHSNIGLFDNIRIQVSDGRDTAELEAFSIEVISIISGSIEKKYRPGHYISMNRWDTQSDMIDAIHPGVMGIQKRYFWKTLEPTEGHYDFSHIRSDLQLLESHGMQLVIFVEDKSFTDEQPLPDYLQVYTDKNRHGGYTALRWKPAIIERMKLLVAELGKELDAEPAFEGIALQESALGLSDLSLTQNDYLPVLYRNALIEILGSAASHFQKSQVFWYMNFLSGQQTFLTDIAEAVYPLQVAMGGPDVLPEDQSLRNLSYPLYPMYEDKMTLFGSMQYNSYAHTRLGSSPSRYWSLQELFEFARDELKVNYVFWNRKDWKDNKDYDWRDALPVIEANPTFNVN